MYAKLVGFVLLLFVLVLVLSSSLSIGAVDLRSYFLALDSPPVAQPPRAANAPAPLRFYMYDLPRRFNVGMLNRSSEQTLVTALTWPPWPKSLGLKRQHSIEYWMTGSLL